MRKIVSLILIVSIFSSLLFYNSKKVKAMSIVIGGGAIAAAELLLDVIIVAGAAYCTYEVAEEYGLVDFYEDEVNKLFYGNVDGTGALTDEALEIIKEQQIIEFDKYKNTNGYKPDNNGNLLGLALTQQIIDKALKILKSDDVQKRVKEIQCNIKIDNFENPIISNIFTELGLNFNFPNVDTLEDVYVDGSKFVKGSHDKFNPFITYSSHRYVPKVTDTLFKNTIKYTGICTFDNSMFYSGFVVPLLGQSLGEPKLGSLLLEDYSSYDKTNNNPKFLTHSYNVYNSYVVNGEFKEHTDKNYYESNTCLLLGSFSNDSYYVKPVSYDLLIGYTDFAFDTGRFMIYYHTDKMKFEIVKDNYYSNTDLDALNRQYAQYLDFSNVNGLKIQDSINLLPSEKLNYENTINKSVETFKVSEPNESLYVTKSDLNTMTDNIVKIQTDALQGVEPDLYFENLTDNVVNNSSLIDTSAAAAAGSAGGNPQEPGNNDSNGDFISNPPVGNVDWKDVFPFCLPFDLYDIFSLLVAEPKAPVIKIKNFSLNSSYKLNEIDDLIIDFSVFDIVAKIFRYLILLLVCIGLIKSSNNLIGGGKT